MSRLGFGEHNTASTNTHYNSRDIRGDTTRGVLDKMKKALDAGLLLVNKLVNREATEVLYSEAQFVFLTGHEFMKFFSCDLGKYCYTRAFCSLMLTYGKETQPSIAANMFPSRLLMQRIEILFVSNEGGPSGGRPAPENLSYADMRAYSHNVGHVFWL